MSPADTVIQLFGGVSPTAKILGIDTSAVCLWRTRGGAVPQKRFAALLLAAQQRGLDLTIEHLVNGSSRRVIKMGRMEDAFSRMAKELER